MTPWMNYLYSQQPMPTNATGVPVHLTATDPNGNFQDIGTATSNDLGNYAIAWTPPVPGLYTVTATFEGTNGYFGSRAGTSFLVSEASSAVPIVTASPAPTQSTPPTSPPIQTASPSPSQAVAPAAPIPAAIYIAIAAAVIVIVVAAAAVVLRRRR